MRNLRLDICYDGTRYRGWQRLPGRDDTIQGKLETALSRILEEPIEVSGSGRTDAGATASDQDTGAHGGGGRCVRRSHGTGLNKMFRGSIHRPDRPCASR